ncbi:putative copper resistance protein D [Silvimonas terrae]|uniref:Putative copper resistance protein D n=1 Tax=Silvimonas terrae TaxID=300266 RepID=A0A840RD42_9NEIS|nr:CopD family protein [Silvimonas terrae]MBB5190191.1 putative copper resistance protein D [Silvimonas terrae]
MNMEWAGPGPFALAALLDSLTAVLVGQWLLDHGRINWRLAALACLAFLLLLPVNGAGMAGVEITAVLPALPAILSTHFGYVWLAGVVVMALLLTVALRPVPARLAGGVILTGFVYLRARTGHVADAGMFSIAAAVHTVHLLAAGAWAGSALVFVTRHTRQGRTFDTHAARRLSQLAAWALLLIALTGAANVWRMLAGPLVSGFWQQPWGVILKVKLLLVGVAVLLGATNRWSVLPALDLQAVSGQRRFLALLWLEILAFAGVFACAALLGSTSPPMNM